MFFALPHVSFIYIKVFKEKEDEGVKLPTNGLSDG